MNWDDYYWLALNYYEAHGDLNVPDGYITKNGDKKSKNGVDLALWLCIQRFSYNGIGVKRLTGEQIKLLNDIEMIWNVSDFKRNLLWNENYELAKIYFKHNGNLDIKQKFRTKNGYEEDPEGVKIGIWIQNQRVLYTNGNLSDDRKKLLDEIGMIWKKRPLKWKDYYRLAKIYYEHHENLKIKQNFKTKNGYEEDPEGYPLGGWIKYQRQLYEGNKKGGLSSDRINLLNDIEMIWKERVLKWEDYYKLAKAYYEHYGNLDVPFVFRTENGYEISPEASDLGQWISVQRKIYKKLMTKRKVETEEEISEYSKLNRTLSKDRIKLLEDIEMIWNLYEYRWNKNYELAKAYYEFYGNLDIAISYRTTNGYEKDPKGSKIGEWLDIQRSAYRGYATNKIAFEQIKLLNEIGMMWNPYEDRWFNNYKLAKAYYDYYGDLDVKQGFKTKNGYEEDIAGTSLGSWLDNQRLAYSGKGNKAVLSDKKISLLDDIEMAWFKTNNKKSQDEIITDENIKRKQVEILSRVRSYLNKLNDDEIFSKEDINQGFIEELDKDYKRIVKHRSRKK